MNAAKMRKTELMDSGLSDYESEPQEWREDHCVICFEKCLILGDSSSFNKYGKIHAGELLSVLDVTMESMPDAVTVCVTCSGAVGKLQMIHEELLRTRAYFKSLQAEIVLKISQSEEEAGRSYSRNENNVRKALRQRWKPDRLSPIKDSDQLTELQNIHSKLPRDLIISPASPSALDDVTSVMIQEDDLDQDLSFDEDQNEIQFHLDPSDFGGSEIQFNGESSGGSSIGAQENSRSGVECIEVQDSDEDEEEIDAADLIPTVEINTFDGETFGDFEDTQWGNTSNCINQNSVDVKEFNHLLQQRGSPADATSQDYFYQNGDELHYNGSNGLCPPPVGQPAVSPVYQSSPEKRSRSTRRRRQNTNSTNSGNSKTNKGNPHQPVFSCTVCTEQFRSREKFKEHLESHNGKAPTCVLCQKVFPRKHNLMIHMRTHTGEKPYDCPVCHKPYSDRSNFNAHVRKHMAKPFACTICGRMFDQSNAAHVHATSIHPDEAVGKIISKVTFKA